MLSSRAPTAGGQSRYCLLTLIAFVTFPACGSAVFSELALMATYLYDNGSPASPAKPSGCFGGIKSHSATCHLPRRMGGSGILIARPIVFGLQMRTPGSTKMALDCRMLQQRRKHFTAMGTHDRMRHHCHVQLITAERTR